MFERYTEKARRAVFFARYEASQFGSAFIDTQHLLLGLLREDKLLFHHFQLKVDFEMARQNVASRIKQGNPIPTSVDLPISEQAKRALKYAAEEADRLDERQISTTHLLLGLARDEKFASALVKGGWKRDQCAICRWGLYETGEASHGTGFTNGRDWICTECHARFIDDDFFSPTYSDIT